MAANSACPFRFRCLGCDHFRTDQSYLPDLKAYHHNLLRERKPILTATDRSDFLRRQVLTSRNIHGSWLTDLAMGGLNYQIEHHLFPSAPRPSLRRCQPLIREFCGQRGLPYCETSLASSFASVLRHLNSVGRLSQAQARPRS